MVYLQSATARRELPVGRLRKLCRRGSKVLPDGSDPLSACELAGWLDWQDALWGAQRLFPKRWYRIPTDVNAASLRRQMELNPAEKAASKE